MGQITRAMERQSRIWDQEMEAFRKKVGYISLTEQHERGEAMLRAFPGWMQQLGIKPDRGRFRNRGWNIESSLPSGFQGLYITMKGELAGPGIPWWTRQAPKSDFEAYRGSLLALMMTVVETFEGKYEAPFPAI